MVIAELDQVGGLVGAVFPSEPEPTILDTCAATGDVWGRINVGGAFGHVRIDFSDLSSVEITHCAASGAVTGWETAVGGLIGRASIDNSLSSYIEVRDSYATGSVIGVGAVGGFLGHSEGESGDRIVIENVYASGTVDGGTGNYIGGLAGLTYYTDFRSSFSSGNVNGHWYVAGLIGDANTDTSITASYTTSSITASSGTGIGAFVGWSDGASYAQNHFEADSSGLPGVGFVNSGSPGSDVMGYTLAELQCPTAAGSTTCAAGTLYLDWDSYLNEEGEPAWDFGGTTDLPGLQIDGEVRRNPETL
jgi:hypothetical protein